MTDAIHHAWIEGESTLVIGEPIRCVCGSGADVARGTADVGWCMECWPALRGAVAA